MGVWFARRQEAGVGGEKGCSSPGPTPIPWAGGMEWEELKCGGADFRGVQSQSWIHPKLPPSAPRNLKKLAFETSPVPQNQP